MRPDWIVPGTYRESCTEIIVRKGTLEARCRKIGGKSNWSTLALKGCYGDITNDNGVLRCGGRQVHAPIPKGSYRQSCRDIELQGAVLTAECRDNRGNWALSNLDLKPCRGQVVNHDGVLVCR